MDPRVVEVVILHGVESKHADTIEAHMVCRPDRLQDIFSRAEIFERFKPRVKYRFYRGIVFEIPTVDWPRTWVLIKVNVKFLSRRFVCVARKIFIHVSL